MYGINIAGMIKVYHRVADFIGSLINSTVAPVDLSRLDRQGVACINILFKAMKGNSHRPRIGD
jgi:hypothetical protein